MLDFNGLLFIGDPHVSSKRPGRRKDDYLTSVLGKLEQCASLCHERALVPVILGDLFHRNDDSNLRMLNRLVKALKRFPVPPIVLEGNHDKEQSTLGEADALTLLAETGVVRVVSRTGLAGRFVFPSGTVALHMVPHGSPIPERIERLDNELTVMVTHHDMAFGSAYPGSLPLTAIEGADMVVNGHMHDTKKPVKVGETWWHNPGNIEPLSVDLADHAPCAWSWEPGQGVQNLTALPLVHGTDLFDLTGLHVEASDSLAAVQAVVAEQASEFARELGEQSTLDAQRTDDASVLLEDLEQVLQAAGASDATRLLMTSLARDLVQSEG